MTPVFPQVRLDGAFQRDCFVQELEKRLSLLWLKSGAWRASPAPHQVRFEWRSAAPPGEGSRRCVLLDRKAKLWAVDETTGREWEFGEAPRALRAWERIAEWRRHEGGVARRFEERAQRVEERRSGSGGVGIIDGMDVGAGAVGIFRHGSRVVDPGNRLANVTLAPVAGGLGAALSLYDGMQAWRAERRAAALGDREGVRRARAREAGALLFALSGLELAVGRFLDPGTVATVLGKGGLAAAFAGACISMGVALLGVVRCATFSRRLEAHSSPASKLAFLLDELAQEGGEEYLKRRLSARVVNALKEQGGEWYWAGHSVRREVQQLIQQAQQDNRQKMGLYTLLFAGSALLAAGLLILLILGGSGRAPYLLLGSSTALSLGLSLYFIYRRWSAQELPVETAALPAAPGR